MTLMDIANELIAGCREDRTMENLDKLYAADAVSVEAVDETGQGRAAHGLDAIKGKHAWWDATFDFISGDISEPMPHGDDRFAVIFDLSVKHKESGAVSDMKEVGVYHVANGKITREEFFYSA